MRLEEIVPGSKYNGIVIGEEVVVENVKRLGDTAISVVYETKDGSLNRKLLYRDVEPNLELVTGGLPWNFESDGHLFRLVSEAKRISLAYLFDPMLAVHTSSIRALPHQITAVYQEMLPRQPLRFLLADDPGAGKTIMAGLLIKELIVRGDLERCLICCPGSLVSQWQDELWQKFQLEFSIISNQSIEDSLSGNPYSDKKLTISRLDHMSRNEHIQNKLKNTEWDLVIVDEAHKMAAHYYGDEVRETKRFKLGRIIGSPLRTRHFLLMTATPHNGKEEDFQLFLSLLDGDRFEGKVRDSVHTVDTTDVMRRMVKEELVNFDGTPLFPPRYAYTVGFTLSEKEVALYSMVTDYVREEMNRADRLKNEGEGRRGNMVGFALTSLQRRLASSPEAIYQSLKRRKEKLERRLEEEKVLNRGRNARIEEKEGWDDDDWDEWDEKPSDEIEEEEQEIVERASAASTIEELEAEIKTLKSLVETAYRVKVSGEDKKWEELSQLLEDNPEIKDTSGNRRKIIIFTEHKDTLKYLTDKIITLLGNKDAVVNIHGGVKREERTKIQELFMHDKNVHVLVATDAAGEGVNLQRAHLLVNYDLPWNPNRLEQRFGRIHRIGQTEVCHMWSLVATETREGDVYYQLLRKIETEREAFQGRIFDILGKIFEGAQLRNLLISAIRSNNNHESEDLKVEIDYAFNPERIRQLLDEEALAHDVLDPTQVQKIREDMERAEARKLQPHFIRSFFEAAFQQLNGKMNKRESNRYEITNVPAVIRNRDREIGVGEVVLKKYQRVCFDKELINYPNKPLAAFISPGHPLLDSTIDLILERYSSVLKQGSVLVDDVDETETPRILFFVEHTIQDARIMKNGKNRVVSKRILFVEVNEDGISQNAGYAPFMNYRPLDDEEKPLVADLFKQEWLKDDLESRVDEFAVEHVVPKHLKEVSKQIEEWTTKAMSAVNQRLIKEIYYWDHRATILEEQEQAGKQPKINAQKARERADEMRSRHQRRMDELEKQKQLSPLPPNIIAGAFIVPKGLIERLKGLRRQEPKLFANETKRVEMLAMNKVMETERRLGYIPEDVSHLNLGYDIESKDRTKGTLRFIEVKGRVIDANEVTITKNEIYGCFNKPESFILAIVRIDGDIAHDPAYIRNPFEIEPDFGATKVTYSISKLLTKAEAPS